MPYTTFSSPVSPSDVVKQLFAAAKTRDDAYFSYFTEDALFQAGSAPPVYGLQGIREYLAPILDTSESVDHVITVIWELGDTVICQGEVIYTRWDGKVVTPIPTCNIIRVEGEKIRELRAYGDVSPLFT